MVAAAAHDDVGGSLGGRRHPNLPSSRVTEHCCPQSKKGHRSALRRAAEVLQAAAADAAAKRGKVGHEIFAMGDDLFVSINVPFSAPC